MAYEPREKKPGAFSITGCWDLGAISQYEPELGPSAPSSPSKCSLVLPRLFFLIVVHKAILPATFSGQMGSGSRELPKLHPVGAGPLPLAFLSSGCTPPTPTPPALSTHWLPAGREQYFPKYTLYVIWVEAPGVTLGQFARSEAEIVVQSSRPVSIVSITQVPRGCPGRKRVALGGVRRRRKSAGWGVIRPMLEPFSLF